MSKADKNSTTTFDQIKSRFIGKPGTEARDRYEVELTLEIAGHLIRELRKSRKLTQGQLGELLGVQKSQISKIETNMKSINLSTLLKVLNALEAKIQLRIEIPAR